MQKVFDTGDKLFELSCDDAVAIMVNGNLHFLGVPWELFIKEFRDVKRDQKPESIEAWAELFIAFVCDHKAVSGVAGLSWLAQFAVAEVQFLQQEVLKKWKKAFEDKAAGAGDDGFHEQLLEDLLDRQFEILPEEHLSSLRGLSQEYVDETLKPAILQIVEDRYGSTTSSDQNLKITKLITARLLSTLESDTQTGLVVCGFAGDSLFPSLYAIGADGIVGGRLRHLVTHNVEITRDLTPQDGKTKELGTAISFAQTDVINRLLRGADDRFVTGSTEFIESSIRQSIQRLFNDQPIKIVHEDGQEIDAERVADILATTLSSQFEHVHARELGDEIETAFKQTIALMPKQELIELAEALVSITAVERKATRHDAGTVGGPIDVALITRSEGFVWVKRKHHFSAVLNPRYISRLSQRMSDGGSS